MAKIDVFELPVLPAADVFPMMPEDDLQELADDIRENGLREPLVIADVETVNGDGEVALQTMLVDGRKRRAACRLAKAQPEVRRLNGEDPTAYVLSANVHRRHMTKGQRAMAVAMVRPEAKIGRGSDEAKVASNLGLSGERIRQARTAIRYSVEGDLAKDVMAGAMTLDAAYGIARQRRDAASSEESRLDGVQRRYPELADKVVEGELTLAGACAEAQERDTRARTQRANLFSHLGKIVYVANTIGSDANVRHAFETLRQHELDFQTQERCSTDALIDACELAQHYLPFLVGSLKEWRHGDGEDA